MLAYGHLVLVNQPFDIYFNIILLTESTSVVTDGSGFVTGLALHHMRHEKQLLERQNDQLRSRVQKLKDEFTAEREKLNGVRYVFLCACYIYSVRVSYGNTGF